MFRLAKVLTLLLVWFAAMWGVLQLRRLDSGIFPTHGICGPWGCGPPAAALVSMHGFWVALLAGPVALAIAELPGRARQRLGGVLLLLGALAVLGLVLHQAATYLPHVPPGEPTYFAQRCLFALATFADLPLPAVILAGFVLICIPPKPAPSCSGREEWRA